MALDLTEQRKQEIDAMSYEEMLRKWRFAPTGDPAFQHGPVFDYFSARMTKLRVEGADHVGASKSIGW